MKRTLVSLSTSYISCPYHDVILPDTSHKVWITEHVPFELLVVLVFPADENDQAYAAFFPNGT